MTLEEAMACRHTVRNYLDRPLPREIVEQLTARVDENNRQCNLAMKLVTENGDAFGPFTRLILAKGVRNYLILAGRAGEESDERLGYCSADMMLYAQTLGLNSWWVGGTFSRKGAAKHVAAGGGKIIGVVALGYGANQGVPHKSKAPEEISSYDGDRPEWFAKGVEALLLAPTALNQQAFTVKGRGDQVSLTCNNGVFYAVDKGIGKYHFELGAGKENFRWA